MMFAEITFRLQNIIDLNGIGLAVTGLSIVFAALTTISIFIALLPKILEMVSGIFPSEPEHPAPKPSSDTSLDDAVVVAIGFALRARSHRSPPADAKAPS